MTGFCYIVAEGVHDVTFLGRLLSVSHDARRIRRLEDLDDSLRAWLTTAFKWPRFTGRHHDIERLAVPAPVFYRLATGQVVALRSAQGLTEIGRTLEIDLEAFVRAWSSPDAIGVVLDSDDEPGERRFARLNATLGTLALEGPATLGQFSAGAPRVGVFALPAPGTSGTLEDVLLSLGEAAYPELTEAAREYANRWRQKADEEPAADDWKELRRPSGMKKAAIGAMTAILKPGRSAQVSLEDNRWVSEPTRTLACLQPSLAFLTALVGPAPDSAGVQGGGP
ncbi:MAG TPA: DUF3226 domain-containing protein [Kofleriaceae bacterium]|nr:DUF3226 domain-containing protein [Kofleriaceae bacterium]